MEKKWHKISGFVAVVLAVILFAGIGFAAPRMAGASSISNFFNNLLTPIGLGSSKMAELAQSDNSAVNSSGSTSASAAPYQSGVGYEQAVINAVKKATPAVVSIVISENVPVVTQCPYNPFENIPPEFQQFFGNNGAGGGGFMTQCNTGETQLQQVGGGSGFIISSNGLILTNKHVVSDTNASYIVITNDGKQYKATVLARDPVQDLALVKIDASGLPTVTLGDSGSLQLGQTAIAIGNALGQFSNTVSVGVVSGLSRTVTASGPVSGGQETISGVIQTDAAINPGNSGGPLLDLNGDVIGIDTAVAENAQGIGFALPINTAKKDIASVQATGQISTPYLGVRYMPLDPITAQQEKTPVNYGALVQADQSSTPAVVPGSPAAQAGIKEGDIITAVNGTQINTSNDLSTLVSGYNVGQTITLTVLRNGQTLSVQVILAQRPAGQ